MHDIIACVLADTQEAFGVPLSFGFGREEFALFFSAGDGWRNV
jgi:hypothetical protein